MIKLYRLQEDSEGNEVVKTCNCERDQRQLMLDSGWTTNPSGVSDEAPSAVATFTCDECGKEYYTEDEPAICEADGCESEDFTAAE